MKSGKPAPIEDLQLIINQKRSAHSITCDVVSEAANWLKSALLGAEIRFQYGACDFEDHYGYAVFIILRKSGQTRLLLEIKVAEIAEEPMLFAEVRSVGRSSGSLFPFFGEISSEEGQKRVLHYIADFILSTESDEIGS